MRALLKKWFERAIAAATDRRSWIALVPLLVPLTFAPWLIVTIHHYSAAPLFRDPGMFEYAAWCFRRGERLYQTIATPDGPLIYLIHAFLQLFTKTSETAFRKADLWFHGVGAFAMGVALAPKRHSREGSIAVSLVWGAAQAGLWLAFILSNDFSASVQREEYYVLLGMLGVVLAYRAVSTESTRLATSMLVIGGALAGANMFGKHTGVIFVFLVLLVAVLAPTELHARKWLLVRAALGVLLGAGLMLAVIALFGSLRGFWFWYFRYPFTAYRFWHNTTWTDVVTRASVGTVAVTAMVLGGAAVALRALPRHALAFVMAPGLLLLAAFAQLKGWGYQYSPVAGSAIVLYTLGLAATWSDSDWTPLRVCAALGLLFIGETHIFAPLRESYWLSHGQKLFDDPAISSAREGAELLKANTRPTDRVFFYGREAILPFLAQRLPAVPYEVPWMIDYGGSLRTSNDPDYVEPTAAQRTAILALQHEVEQDACTRLTTHPPEAMAFMDGDEAGADAVHTVTAFCPPLVKLMKDEYALQGHVKNVRVYVRSSTHP